MVFYYKKVAQTVLGSVAEYKFFSMYWWVSQKYFLISLSWFVHQAFWGMFFFPIEDIWFSLTDESSCSLD